MIVGSPNVNPGYKLVDNAAYPQIADDYQRMWKVLKSLPCDIFLGAHGSYFNMLEKYAHLGEGTNPFIDPDGFRQFIGDREKAFDEELARQKAAVNHK